MGMDAVPFILKDLMTNGPDDWFWALSKITGENPITEDIAGDMNKMTEAWLLWARKSGYQVTCRPVKKQDSPDSIQATIE